MRSVARSPGRWAGTPADGRRSRRYQRLAGRYDCLRDGRGRPWDRRPLRKLLQRRSGLQGGLLDLGADGERDHLHPGAPLDMAASEARRPVGLGLGAGPCSDREHCAGVVKPCHCDIALAGHPPRRRSGRVVRPSDPDRPYIRQSVYLPAFQKADGRGRRRSTLRTSTAQAAGPLTGLPADGRSLVRVHTDMGSELTLMSLSQAIAGLNGLEGLQTHRSW